MIITTSDKFIDELVYHIGGSLVGKILKRIEIIDNPKILKAVVKEMVYEELRHMKDILLVATPNSTITQVSVRKNEEIS